MLNKSKNAEIKIKMGIMLVCGVPASGKSTFCRKILEMIYEKNSDIFPIYIDFDEEIGFIDFSMFINDKEYKIKRNDILLKLENLIHFLINDIKIYHYKNFINYVLSEKLINLFKNQSKQQIDFNNIPSILIILDDTFYLKSMRYQVYKISKKCKLYSKFNFVRQYWIYASIYKL